MAMEQKCLLCGVERQPGVRRCDCGYVYAPPPREGHYSGDDPAREGDGLPSYAPSGWVSLFLLVVMSGTNGVGACLVIVAIMPAMVVGKAVNVGACGYLFSFGLSAIAADLIGRRLLRCSLFDVKKGSQFMLLPVWVIGIFGCLAGVIAVAATYP
jgi:hypothetical protein